MITHYILLALRYFLGLLFVATAVGKLLDNRGFAQVINAYELGISDSMLLGTALAISLLELSVGISILCGWKLSKSILTTLWFHLGYAGLALLTLLRGITLSNCGCFGVFLARPLKWQTVAEDLALAAISLTCWLLLRRVRHTSAKKA
jgi:Methylamine utilisation protein MauE